MRRLIDYRSQSARYRACLWFSLILIAAALGVDGAHADESVPKPWAQGVSEERQAAALELFGKGNTAFAQRSYAAALREYKEAIGHWDHPAIRFNISECYIHLDQFVEAHENLELALKFGKAPLEETIYERALTNRKLLSGRLSVLVVKSADQQVAVTLNGEPLDLSSGTVTRVIEPGRHQLVGTKPGMLTQTQEVLALPGETKTADVALQEIGSVALVRRWDRWKPWAVVGSGVAVGVVAVGLQVRARSNRDTYDDFLATDCPAGCAESELPENIRGARDAYPWQDVSSLALAGLGASLVTGGAVMLWLNQPKAVEQREPQFAIAPLVTSKEIGLMADWRF